MDKLNENYQHNRRGNAAGCVATSHINALAVLSRDRAYYALFLNKHFIYIKGKGLINQGFSGINCKKMQSFFVSEFMKLIIFRKKYSYQDFGFFCQTLFDNHICIKHSKLLG